MTGPDLAAQDVIGALDSFYCHNIVVALWAAAVACGLEGLAIYLLSDELPEVAGHARPPAPSIGPGPPSLRPPRGHHRCIQPGQCLRYRDVPPATAKENADVRPTARSEGSPKRWGVRNDA